MPFSARESKNPDSAPSGAALMHIEGPTAGQGFAMPEPVNSIGPGADNTVVLADDNQVSRRHAEVRAEDGEYVLYDLQSSNGTYVNEERITRHPLSDGDRVRVGQTILLFQAASAEVAVADAVIVVEPAEEAGEAIAPPPTTGEEKSEEIEQLLAEAKRLEQEGNAAEAVSRYRQALTQLPEDSPLRREGASQRISDIVERGLNEGTTQVPTSNFLVDGLPQL